MAGTAQLEHRFQLQADAGGLLLEMEQLLDLAGGQRRAAARCRAAGGRRVARIAAGLVIAVVRLGILVIDAGKQAVVEQAVLVLVFEAEAGALAFVVAAHRRHPGERGRHAHDGGLGVLLTPFQAGRQLVAGDRAENQLGEQAAIFRFGRVGRGTGRAVVAVAALVLRFAAIRLGVAEQDIEALAAQGADHAAGQRVAGTEIAAANPDSVALVALGDVFRIERQVADHAADGIRTVETGCRAADDLDLLQEVEHRAGGAFIV